MQMRFSSDRPKLSSYKWQCFWSVDPKSLAFSYYHPDEVRAISVVEVWNPINYDLTGEPAPGGLYDLSMGK